MGLLVALAIATMAIGIPSGWPQRPSSHPGWSSVASKGSAKARWQRQECWRRSFGGQGRAARTRLHLAPRYTVDVEFRGLGRSALPSGRRADLCALTRDIARLKSGKEKEA